MKEWWSGAHSVFENGSERVSALILSLMSESWAKLKKLMSVEHVENYHYKVAWILQTNVPLNQNFKSRVYLCTKPNQIYLYHSYELNKNVPYRSELCCSLTLFISAYLNYSVAWLLDMVMFAKIQTDKQVILLRHKTNLVSYLPRNLYQGMR